MSHANDFQAELAEQLFADEDDAPEIERDEAEMRIAELEAVLRDLILGADMMLQQGLQWAPHAKGYIQEVRRVARAGLYGV